MARRKLFDGEFEAIKTHLRLKDKFSAQGRWNYIKGYLENYVLENSSIEDEYSRKLRAELDVYQDMIDEF